MPGTLRSRLLHPCGALVLTATLFGVAAIAHAAPVSFGGSYTQNFDTLTTQTGSQAWTNDSTLAGWHLYAAVGAAITTYVADNGAGNSGSFISYGTTGSAERALGGLGSGGTYFGSPASDAIAGYIALAASNTTGATIDTLTVSFNGEQWRASNAASQPMVMQYAVVAADTAFGAVASNAWQAAAAFTWQSPVTGTSGAVDGNVAGRVAVSGTLTSLNWQAGQTLWLRWIELNDTGSDHGLAIDDFSMSSGSAPAGPTFAIAATSADKAEGHSGSTDFTFTVTRGGDTTASSSIDWAATGSGASAADAADFGGTLPGGTLSFAAGETSKVVTVGVTGDTDGEPDEEFTVTLSGASSGSITTATAKGIIRNDDASAGFTRISAIQGSGDASPHAGNNVAYTVQGMLTHCAPNLYGFVLQATRDEEKDDNPATSEGLFVYYGTAAGAKPAFIDACPTGTTYQVTGKVSEYNKQTQLSSPGNYVVVHSGGALPAPVKITLPVASLADLERYEGMLVEVSSATAGGKLVVTDNYTLGRYGNVSLAADGLQVQFAELNTPDVAGNQAWLDGIRRHQIQLDDNSGLQNPSVVLGRNGLPLSAGNTLRAGDGVNRIVGYLDQFDSGLKAHETPYRVQPTETPVFTGPERPTAESIPQAIRAAAIKVASANVLNYFTTFNTVTTTNETNIADDFLTPTGARHDSRGANNEAEFVRQRAKIVANLTGLDADVIGLMEIQNNGFDAPTSHEGGYAAPHEGKSAIRSLVDAVNAALEARAAGSGTYAYVKGPFTSGSGTASAPGSDAIMVALIYKTDKVTPVGQAAVPDQTAAYDAFWGDPAKNGNRVPVAQTFQSNANGEKFTVVVNHFKSKSSGTVDQGEDRNDGQGNSYLAREKAAKQLTDWLATSPTGDADADVLLLGDFNAYGKEKTVTDLIAAGYRKVSEGYSYSFDGLWGALDHIFASNALQASGQIAGVHKWAINAEEPVVLDYNTDFNKPAGAYAETPYSSSDHNPVIIGLNLGQPQFTLPLAGEAGSLTGRFSATTCQLLEAPELTSTLPASAPAGWALPYGLLGFTAESCGDAGRLTLTLTFPQPLPAGAKLWKWGATHDNTDPHWYTLPAQFSGPTVTYTLTDGAAGDDDLKVDGRIVDPVTVGVPLGSGLGSPTPVPALNPWMLMLMGLLVAGATARQRRRRG